MIKIKPIHMQNCNCEECNFNRQNNIMPININELSEEDKKLITDYLAKQATGNVKVSDSNKSIDFPKSALRFNGFNIYTNNDVVNIPANIYNTFALLGIKITDLLLQDTNSDTLKFDMNTLGTIVSTNMCMCIDSFILTLDNLYSVHINQINERFKPFLDIILNNMTAEEDSKFDSYIRYFSFTPVFHFINREDLSRAIISYISIGPECRANMYNNVMAFTTAYINKAGISIYNELRNEATSLCENKFVTKNNSNIVNEIFGFLNNEFANMMISFTHEAAIFSDTIVENFDILFNPRDFLSRALNTEIPDFTYPNDIK